MKIDEYKWENILYTKKENKSNTLHIIKTMAVE